MLMNEYAIIVVTAIDSYAVSKFCFRKKKNKSCCVLTVKYSINPDI